MAQNFEAEFEDYIIFHRGVANTYIDDNMDLHIVYQDGYDQNLGNPYGNYVDIAVQAASMSNEGADAARRWAVGQHINGQDVSADDETYQNNSKYYAQLGQRAEEYTYGTQNGVVVPERIGDNAKFFYEQLRTLSDRILVWDNAAEFLHYNGETESAADTANKIVTVLSGDGIFANDRFIPKRGMHLSVLFKIDNAAQNVRLLIGDYDFPVLFSGAENFDKLCGTCEFILRYEGGFFWEFESSNKYEPIIYAEGALPVEGKLGQICVLKKAGDDE